MNQLLARRIGLTINDAATLRKRNRLTIVNHLKKGTISAFYISEGVKRVINSDCKLEMPNWMPLTQEMVATLWSCSRSHIAQLLSKPEGDDFHLSRTEGKVTYGDVLDFMERNKIRIQSHLA